MTVYFLIVSPKLVGFQADIPPLMAVCLFVLAKISSRLIS
ncbi:hypothetical protein AO368_0937 [Moraxella catarrhalis]|nr:hypothetical protein AO368_0937 [Moraxella catarrhalis]